MMVVMLIINHLMRNPNTIICFKSIGYMNGIKGALTHQQQVKVSHFLRQIWGSQI